MKMPGRTDCTSDCAHGWTSPAKPLVLSIVRSFTPASVDWEGRILAVGIFIVPPADSPSPNLFAATQARPILRKLGAVFVN